MFWAVCWPRAIVSGTKEQMFVRGLSNLCPYEEDSGTLNANYGKNMLWIYTMNQCSRGHIGWMGNLHEACDKRGIYWITCRAAHTMCYEALCNTCIADVAHLASLSPHLLWRCHEEELQCIKMSAFQTKEGPNLKKKENLTSHLCCTSLHHTRASGAAS